MRAVAPPDRPGLEQKLASALGRAGLDHPHVVFRVVDEIPRQSSGKLKRFVSLPTS